MSDTKERVIDVTADILGVDAGTISDESRFVEDLGAESIQSIELVAAFEEEFEIEMDEDAALHAAAAMQEGEVIDIDAAIFLSAAKISSTMNLPMADSMILAVAKQHNAVIWTQDSDFKDIKGVTYIGE